jgi:hypothetical protein
MRDLREEDFEALCAAPAVRAAMDGLEGRRRDAVRRFWRRLAIGVALSGLWLWALLQWGWDTTGWIGSILLLIGSFAVAAIPLGEAKEGLKHPVLEELGRRVGMEFIPREFVPPVFASARTLLFGGGGFSTQTFTDLFNGADDEGRGCAVYEACLQRRAGRNTYTVFSGQIYALQRRPGAREWTLILPDRKLLNFWKPASDLHRLPVPDDPAFERRFEVYAGEPEEGRAMAADPALRALLLELRKGGRVYLYAGPDEVLLAVGGKDRFEPGNMFRARPAEERVRAMFDEVRTSLATLARLKAKLG